MAKEKIEIYDIMACNVFWNFPNTGLPQEQHKFLVAFHPTGGRPVPELIESIRAKGPDGYEQEIANQTFTAANCNGHIFDRTTNSHWYMLNLATGFMKEGKYTIEVTGKDGVVRTMSRFQKDAPGQALVTAYRQAEKDIHNSFQPADGSQLPVGSPLKDLQITWTPLSELTGQDAYYILRLSEGRNAREFDTQNLAWWDNIFLQRFTLDPKAGLNRTGVTISSELKPDTAYCHFTEITDSNAMGDTNMCIFQPHQTFRTAARVTQGGEAETAAN